MAISWTEGRERVTCCTSVKREAFPEKPRNARDSGGIADKGKRWFMEVIQVRHSLHQSGRGIGGSGLVAETGLARGRDGSRRRLGGRGMSLKEGDRGEDSELLDIGESTRCVPSEPDYLYS